MLEAKTLERRAAPAVLLPCECSQQAAPHPATAKPLATKSEESQPPLTSCKPRLLPLQSTTFQTGGETEECMQPAPEIPDCCIQAQGWKWIHLGLEAAGQSIPTACVQIVFQVLKPTLGAALSWHCRLAEHGFLPWC